MQNFNDTCQTIVDIFGFDVGELIIDYHRFNYFFQANEINKYINEAKTMFITEKFLEEKYLKNDMIQEFVNKFNGYFKDTLNTDYEFLYQNGEYWTYTHCMEFCDFSFDFVTYKPVGLKDKYHICHSHIDYLHTILDEGTVKIHLPLKKKMYEA